MFSDSLVSVMIMLLLCFVGMLVMFLFIIRSLSSQTAALRESFSRQQRTLADMEQLLMDMNFAMRKGHGEEVTHESSGKGAVSSSSGSTFLPQGAVSSASKSPSSDLQEIFNQPAEKKTLSSPAPKQQKDYSYPSAAGFGPMQSEDLMHLNLSPLSEGRGSEEAELPPGLNIKTRR